MSDRAWELVGTAITSGVALYLLQATVEWFRSHKKTKVRQEEHRDEIDLEEKRLEQEAAKDLRRELWKELGITRNEVKELREKQEEDRVEYENNRKRYEEAVDREHQRYLDLLADYNRLKARCFLMEMELDRLRKLLKEKGVELPISPLDQLDPMFYGIVEKSDELS